MGRNLLDERHEAVEILLILEREKGEECLGVDGEGAVELPLEEGRPVLRLPVAEVGEPLHVEPLAARIAGRGAARRRPDGQPHPEPDRRSGLSEE
ncbi:hypothetical protein [Candidatus Palauibacter sp.]|uniref:hypothetical protein n=1 Tax=Candidatus Palauibacter sp. TaxID=3101350 RepID=UPI003AF20780